MNSTPPRKKNGIRSAAILAACGIITTSVFVVSSLWVKRAADNGTAQAASNVSEFYIEEFAHQRVQSILGEIKQNYSYIANALGEMTEADLESKESLRAYLRKIRNLYGIETFSLMDEDNVLYTGNSTSTVSDDYLFIKGDGTDPSLHTTNIYGAKKQVILSVPIHGIKFKGRKIKYGFVKIDMSRIVSSTALHADGSKTYCGLYHKTGENLTNLEFGRIPSRKNLLTFIGESKVKGGRTFRDVAKDFREQHFGSVHAEHGGDDIFLHYVPIYGTEWMLTLLVYDNVISDHITNVTKSMLIRNRMQLALMTFTLALIFLTIFFTYKRDTKRRADQEKKAAERVKEAYEKLNKESEAMNIIHEVLNSGPWGMEFDRNGNITSCYWSDIFRKMLGYTDENDFPNKLESWTDLIHEDDKERVLKDYWAAVHDYTGKTIYDSKYRMLTKDRGWRWFHDSGSLTRRSDGSPVSYVGLFIDIDEIKKSEEALKEQFYIFEALGRDYKNIFKVDPKTKQATVLKVNGCAMDKIAMKKHKPLNYEKSLENYIRHRVHKDDREFLSAYMALPVVMENLQKKNEYSRSYRVTDKDEVHFFQFKFMLLEDGMLIAAFSNIDDMVHAAREREMLKTMSETDLMTGLLNRGSGESRVSKLLKSGTGGLFFLLDVDNFKHFNDNFGHDVGDKVIIGVARCLKDSFRRDDIVFRLGGDEFSVYAFGISNIEDAKRALDKFKNALAETYIPELGKNSITVSIGATIVKNGDQSTFPQKYKLVDSGVYESKKKEGTVVTFK